MEQPQSAPGLQLEGSWKYLLGVLKIDQSYADRDHLGDATWEGEIQEGWGRGSLIQDMACGGTA